MDKYNIEIIRLLHDNARATVSEIAGKIELSIPAVSERLKKLEASGIIEKYTLILNCEKMGRSLRANILIHIDGDEESFNQFIMEEKEILECMYIAGGFDYMLDVVTVNTQTLEVLLRKIKSFKCVKETRTTIVLSSMKKEFSVMPSEGEVEV